MKLEDGESLGGSAPTAAQAFGAMPQPVNPTPQYRNAPQNVQAINPITGMPM